jgi:hypothetical protein
MEGITAISNLRILKLTREQVVTINGTATNTMKISAILAHPDVGSFNHIT